MMASNSPSFSAVRHAGLGLYGGSAAHLRLHADSGLQVSM